MHELEESKVGFKLWIVTLATSVLLTAFTFAVISVYMGEIKANMVEANDRVALLNEHINTLDTEIMSLHRHILAQEGGMTPVPAKEPGAAHGVEGGMDSAPVAPAMPATPATLGTAAPEAVAPPPMPPPPAGESAAPVIQPPILAAPTPAPFSAPAKP